MKKEHLIKIEISGPVQSGKSAVLGTIKSILEDAGYDVEYEEKELNLNPPDTLETAAGHELPDRNKTVFVLTETVDQ